MRASNQVECSVGALPHEFIHLMQEWLNGQGHNSFQRILLHTAAFNAWCSRAITGRAWRKGGSEHKLGEGRQQLGHARSRHEDEDAVGVAEVAHDERPHRRLGQQQPPGDGGHLARQVLPAHGAKMKCKSARGSLGTGQE